MFCSQQLIRKCVFRKLYNFCQRHILPGVCVYVCVHKMLFIYHIYELRMFKCITSIPKLNL